MCRRSISVVMARLAFATYIQQGRGTKNDGRMIYIYIYYIIYIDRQTDRGRVELPRWGSLTLAPTRRMLCIMGRA